MRERILALLSERPLSVPKLRKALKLRPSEYDELARELTTLQREKLVRMVNGGWILAEGDNAYKPRKRNPASDIGRPLGPKSQAIVDALATGPKRAAELIALTGDDSGTRNRLNDLVARDHIARVGYGKYALPSNTVADALDVRVVDTPHGTVVISEPTADDIAKATADLPTVTTCGLKPDAPADVVAAIGEVSRRALETMRNESLDVRHNLMEAIEMVMDGKLTGDQVDSIIRLADRVVALA